MNASIWKDASRAWVDAQEMLDAMYRPLEEHLVRAARATGAASVLDVGCGTGGTTLAIAAALAPDARVTGVDVAEPMVEAARAGAAAAGLAERVTFLLADAESHALAPASFDLVVSRFGVMFFADPVAAFANLHAAAAPGAPLRFITWRPPQDNPFMTAAADAARPLLPGIPVPTADEPGQFGLATPERTRTLLEAGGWQDVEVAPLDITCTFPAAQLDHYLGRMGLVGRELTGADDARRAEVVEAIRPRSTRTSTTTPSSSPPPAGTSPPPHEKGPDPFSCTGANETGGRPLVGDATPTAPPTPRRDVPRDRSWRRWSLRVPRRR